MVSAWIVDPEKEGGVYVDLLTGEAAEMRECPVVVFITNGKRRVEGRG